MNGPLIALTQRQISGEAAQTIDSVELHAFLGVTTEHGKWMARRIESYGFQDGTDYVCSAEVASKGRGGHNRAVFWISLDMGKQLAMVERGEKGRQAREYFIDCERRAKALAPRVPADLHDPSTLRALLLDNVDQRLRLEHEAADRAPRAAAFDRLASVQGSVCIRDAAKLLNCRESRLKAWLVDHKWVYRSRADSRLQAFACRLDEGYLVHNMVTITHGDGRQSLQPHAKVTPRGLAYLALHLDAYPDPASNRFPSTLPPTVRPR